MFLGKHLKRGLVETKLAILLQDPNKALRVKKSGQPCNLDRSS